MKLKNTILLLLIVVLTGFVLIMMIRISDTYPPIKEYKFNVGRELLERELVKKVNSIGGWSFERKDSVKGKDETCFWGAITYQNELEYTVKYCFKPDKECMAVGIVLVTDYSRQKNFYKITDDGVAEMIKKIERSIFEDLISECDD
jgi:hypothetical protein